MNKILTWNIRHGGGTRIKEILNALSAHKDSQTIILTEYRNNDKTPLLKDTLSQWGFIHQYTIDAEPNKNSVLIVSKEDFKFKTFPELLNHQERVVKVYNDQYSLYGCYFPSLEEKKYVFEFLLKEIKDNPNERIIITGDINTGKHYIDETGTTFSCSEYFQKLEDVHLFDAWRYIHKDKKEYSWYSSAGNGFRLDHFFVDEKLKPQILNCYYLHSDREARVTDHSMMVLEMKE